MTSKIAYQRCRVCWSPLYSATEDCNFCQQYPLSATSHLATLLQLLDSRLQEGRKALEDNLVRHGAEIGWYHHLGEKDRAGIASSAYGLHALSLTSPHSPLLPEIAERIINHPNRYTSGSGSDLEIGWPMAHEPTTPLVEPTCYVLQQLYLAGVFGPDRPEARAAVRWLVSQQQDHAWGPQHSMRPYVYVTALVCQTLSLFYPNTADLYIALDWLDKAQNEDGGWGEWPKDQKSRAWTTAHASLSVLYGRGSTLKGNDVLGIRWLRANADKWTEPYAVEYEFNSAASGIQRGRASYRFDALPIVILALLRSGLRPASPDLLGGIRMLLEKQEAGIWLYPYTTQKTIFNLSHAMQALTEFRRALASPEMLADLYAKLSDTEGTLLTVGGFGAASVPQVSRRKLRTFSAVVLAAVSLLPIVWRVTGTDKLWIFANHAYDLRKYPFLVVVSLSGLLLAAGIGKWVTTRVLLGLWVLLLALALLLSVRGGVLETLAAISPPIVIALVKFLVQESRNRSASRGASE